MLAIQVLMQALGMLLPSWRMIARVVNPGFILLARAGTLIRTRTPVARNVHIGSGLAMETAKM
jgi:hypothetical protein